MQPVVTTSWLAARLGSPGLRVLDGSWYLPGSGRDAATEYLAGHIPGAVFFDLDATSDPGTSLPHMLPSPEAFAAGMTELGITNSDELVIYDGSGANLSAARVWWTFRVFGHQRVAVLDGGLGKWTAENRPLETGAVGLPPSRFVANLYPGLVRSLAAVRANLEHGREQLVDMRSAARFAGDAPEPRPGLRAGHIPGSRNLPYTDLVQTDGTILPEAELRDRIQAAGIDLSQPVVASCGSGTTACTLLLGLELLGAREAALYDGSWAEWGGQLDTPVERGPPSEAG
jgi:thiosulfate/3-mercaptopyruvate sulfurtransferase